jgi:aminoglycoside phosphotransferase (APT) family kinase protein
MSPVTRAEIDDAVKHALPSCGDVTRCRPLDRGHGHQSFVVETSSDATLLLKIALRSEQRDKMTSLRQALQLASGRGVPVPGVIYFSDGTHSFDGRPWLIQEFLAGEDGEDALPKMTDGQRAAFFRAFGRAVACLHSIEPGYFSEDLASSTRHATWTHAVDTRLQRVIDRHLQAELLPRERIASARDAIGSVVRAVSAEIRPALVHRDLYLPNTLATGGRFRALLDFEHARASDALCDFVKLQMWVFDRVPGAAPAFRVGYGADPLSTTDGRLRHRLWFGFELLSGLLYWKQTGQSDMLADYLTRFDRWLRAAPIE